MYMTFSAGSPWAKTVSFAGNLATFLPRPVQWRNSFTSKTGLFGFAFWGERRTLTDTRRTGRDIIFDDSTDSDDCPILNSSCRSTRPLQVELFQVQRIQCITTGY